MQSMKQLIEAAGKRSNNKVPSLEDAPDQSAHISLFPKDFTAQGWSALLYQLKIGPEKHFGVGAKTVQRVEIKTAIVKVAFNTED